ncbi:MAG: hypothetical protein M3R17_11610 [Bacteroidota bacterium]|nr:hypothetical protein [Bacteroidota bacterium]
MFGFGKKKKSHFSSKVLMSRVALDRLLVNGLRNKEIIAVTFFTSTRNELIKTVNDPSLDDHIIPAEKIINGNAIPRINSFLLSGDKKIVFAERYPLSANEIQVAEKLEISGIPLPFIAYASLDDAILLQAGGEKIISMMQKMGMKEDEIIEHSMIESSIKNFQSKIAEKTSFHSHAQSPEEWFRVNIPRA